MSPDDFLRIYDAAISRMASENSMIFEASYIEDAVRSEGLQPEQICRDAYCLLRESAANLTNAQIEALMALCGQDWESPESVPLLNNLLLLKNHQCHEDIVFSLKHHRCPSSVESLVKAVRAEFGYLTWDENRGLARKCMWALASIGNDAAWNAIVEFSNSDDLKIRAWAKEQLVRR